ncbi:MAG: methylenetetrahydrofolate--tRNA-(uracil(54)-C(5))-methyltransferase (FADH(2)-oxidizing) TrmFO, partial [Alphaproteobacteria bacterium]
VHKESIDFEKSWFQSRYDKVGPGGTGADYINCPMDGAQYEAFIDALLTAETAEFREWEKDTPYFEGCLPIEVMAARGRETLRFGPMKPVGLTNPRDPDIKSHAIVQLRQDNALGTLYNIVGFQTKMKYGDQVRVLRMIPGLEAAEFARLGGVHRNSFINSPKLLDPTLRLKSATHIRFAGQITGCEGYIESAAIGLLAARFAVADLSGKASDLPPATSAHGALLAHITGGHLSDDTVGKNGGSSRSFQPMNVNFGLFPPIETPTHSEDGTRIRGKDKTRARKALLAQRALADFAVWAGSDGASRSAA